MDISQSNWTEADASNNTAAPDGMPEGMAPSGVNDWGRAAAGAIKRWYNQTIPLVTGGTFTAYTLSYAVAPTALADGQTHLVQFNAVNGAAPTLNVNALGAKPLHFYAGGAWGACPANMFAIDQIVRVTYNAAAGTYRAIGMKAILIQTISGVTAVDFTGIPANVDSMVCAFELVPSVNATAIGIRTYGADGVLDVGSSDYFWSNWGVNSSGAGSGAGSVTDSAILLSVSADINNSTNGFGGEFTATNIQAATKTKFTYKSTYLNGVGNSIIGAFGGGGRNEADRITGVRFFPSSGTITGKITVILS